MSRSRNVADTQDNNGGAVSPFLAGKNVLINGLFDIWQRATDVTSSTVSATFYAAADRWQTWNGVGASTRYQRIADGDSGVSQYSYRIQRVSGSTTATNYQIIQNMETSISKLLVGKTMTLSFRVKKGANFSPTSGTMIARVQYNNNTDGNAINQATSTAFTGTFSPTTSFATYSVTGTIPSSGVSSIMVNLLWEPTGTAGADDWLEISAVQLEVGSVATPFSRAGGTLAGELAACQRYFQRIVNGADAPTGGYAPVGIAQCIANNNASLVIHFLAPMRTAPTMSVSSASHFQIFNSTAGSPPGLTSFSFMQASRHTTRCDVGNTANNLTAGDAGYVGSTSTSATLDASAEL